ncbi:MAG: cytochrome c3 family protein [bacterium]
MKKAAILFTMFLMVLASSYSVFAQHDNNCKDCHSIHDAKGEKIIAVAPDTKTINPATKKPLSGISALCQGCHIGEGGPEIGIMKSHPVGIVPNPKRAQVPPEWLRDGGLFECSSCHDFHPSNPNYKYLRADVGANGSDLGKFCAVCHSDKRSKGEKKPAAPAEKK